MTQRVRIGKTIRPASGGTGQHPALPPAALRRGAAACALGLLALLSGCAQQGRSPDGADAAALHSDSEARRRAHIRLELAASYLQRGQNAVALEEAGQALAADPGFADAWHLRGLVHMAMGDEEQAQADLERALGMRPRDPDILHNLGWLQCQRSQYARANQLFERALAVPTYALRGKTLLSQGLCQQRAGQDSQAEQTLQRAYQVDPANPATGYHLAALLFAQGQSERAQFHARRVNNGEFSNAESLWLGIKIERALGNGVAMRQLMAQLRKRFPEARQTQALERGAFDE